MLMILTLAVTTGKGAADADDAGLGPWHSAAGVRRGLMMLVLAFGSHSHWCWKGAADADDAGFGFGTRSYFCRKRAADAGTRSQW